jgi:hypothetical protein
MSSGHSSTDVANEYKPIKNYFIVGLSHVSLLRKNSFAGHDLMSVERERNPSTSEISFSCQSSDYTPYPLSDHEAEKPNKRDKSKAKSLPYHTRQYKKEDSKIYLPIDQGESLVKKFSFSFLNVIKNMNLNDEDISKLNDQILKCRRPSLCSDFLQVKDIFERRGQLSYISIHDEIRSTTPNRWMPHPISDMCYSPSLISTYPFSKEINDTIDLIPSFIELVSLHAYTYTYC